MFHARAFRACPNFKDRKIPDVVVVVKILGKLHALHFVVKKNTLKLTENCEVLGGKTLRRQSPTSYEY